MGQIININRVDGTEQKIDYDVFGNEIEFEEEYDTICMDGSGLYRLGDQKSYEQCLLFHFTPNYIIYW